MPEWCVSCWMRSRSRTPATRSLEDDPLCDRCADQYRSDEVADQKSDRDGEAVQELESPAASPEALRKSAERRSEEAIKDVWPQGTWPTGEAVPAAEAAPVKPASAATGFSSDQEASPGSFGPAIKKAFLPKPEKADSQKETTVDEARRTCAAEGCAAKLTAANRSGRCAAHWYVKKTDKAQGGMPPAVIDWQTHDSLKAAGHANNYIARALGIGRSTLDRHVAARNGVERKQLVSLYGRKSVFPKRAQTKASVPQSPVNGHAAESRKVLIDVPEAFLDSFFAKLPIERKVAIFTQELAANR